MSHPPRRRHARTQRNNQPSTGEVVVGVDTGGTFTDLVTWWHGEVRTHKVLSTPTNPAHAVLRGLREMLPDGAGGLLTYASTVATNAVLQRRGAKVVLLTTAGFEDVLEIGRQDRPALYALEPRPPEPLVPPPRRLGVVERTSFEGHVITPLQPEAVRKAVRAVRRIKPDAVAICCLHSYANPRHERMLGAALAGSDVFCSLSHQLIAEYREYERLSTTVVNAYVGPIMSHHLEQLEETLRNRFKLRVMQSNGGAISAQRAGHEAVRTVLSGPAAGVIGAWTVARALRLDRVITFDMGGTSTDVSLLDGRVSQRSEWALEGMPMRIPAIDIHTVGAGGGSIAQADAGGALKVGPQSAGADPGPACYGTGTLATVTDANVLLGRLVADAFLGGRMQLRPSRAEAAVKRLGTRLRLSVLDTAEGVIRVVNAGMERAIRSISVERGRDPRAYTLLAFGGAAGQHACDLAAALGIRRVVIPCDPGLLSAWGAAGAAAQRDYVRTVRLTAPSGDRLKALFATLERTACGDLRDEGVLAAEQTLTRSVDVRYAGQSHEINVPFRGRFVNSFHAAHRRLYGYADPQRSIEVVNIRVQAVGRGPRLPRRSVRVGELPTPKRHRVRWGGRWLAAALHVRSHLRAGEPVLGPAVIMEFSATTFLPPGWCANAHRTGHLVLTHAG